MNKGSSDWKDDRSLYTRDLSQVSGSCRAVFFFSRQSNDNESGSFRSLVAGAQFPLPIYNSEA